MMRSPLVSVIIPTHNRSELLAQTLDSVRGQQFPDWECIVVDDASSDDTPGFLDNQRDMRCFRFDTSQERTRARNFGLGQARGEFVLFLDDDDLLPPRALKMHYEALRQQTGAFGSAGGSEIFWPDGRRQAVQRIKRQVVRNTFSDMIFGWIPVSGQWLFRKKMVEDAGAWNENMVYAEDHELLLRLAARHEAVIVPDIVHFYRAHDQWRPPDMDEIMTRVREDAVERLPAEERAGGKAVLAARALREAAEIAYQEARMREAMKLYFRMLRLAPGIFVSPLTRADVLPPLLKSFFGGRSIRWMRQMKRRGRDETTG